MGIRLTLRDIEILDTLHTARYMTTPQIQALFWRESRGGEAGRLKACQRRLRFLAKHSLVRRIEQMVSRGESRLPYIYALDRKGAETLVRELGVDPASIDWHKKDAERTYPFLQHVLATNDFRIAVKLACEATSSVRLEAWVDEKELKMEAKDYVTLTGPDGEEQRVAVVPDGYFVLRQGEQLAHHFFEIDRATVTVRPSQWQRRGWVRKIQAYLAYYQSGIFSERYATRSLRILTITTGPDRLAHLKEVTEETGGKARFWFTTFELANDPAQVLTAPIWHVASKEGLHKLLP